MEAVGDAGERGVSDEDPREYDKEFTAHAAHRVRRRLGRDIERGEVRRFVVQLEYLVDPVTDEWATVVRYDHDAEGADEASHDVTEDGIHVDVYRDGQKVDTEHLTGPLPANDALRTVEEHLDQHLKQYVRRFERWHGINRSDR